jgi:hypothetical protein
MAASSALKNNWAIHHPARTTAMLGANATTRMPREPPTRPMTIHGRRMPSRDTVRSLILPKNGLPTMASRAPIPATSAKLSGARSIPTSESTFNAKVTSRGAMNKRLVLMYATAYSEIKPQRPGVPRVARTPAQPRLRFGTSIRAARYPAGPQPRKPPYP